MRYAFFALFLMAVLLVSMAGFRGKMHTERALRLFNDMDEQQMLRPQASSELFADGLAARRPVENSIPMGYDITGVSRLAPDLEFGGDAQTGYYQTGRFGESFGQGMPEQLALTEQGVQGFLLRGKERYDIHCAVCHGAAGDGKGVAGQPGRIVVANLLEDRFALAEYPDGQVFDVISHGKGLMVSYGDKIALKDRWAIVAYVRALQEADNPESFVEGIADALAKQTQGEESSSDANSSTTEDAPKEVLVPEVKSEEQAEKPNEVVEQNSETEVIPTPNPENDSTVEPLPTLPTLPGAISPAPES